MDINDYGVYTCAKLIGSVPTKDDIFNFTISKRPILPGDVLYVTATEETYICIEGAKIDNPLPKWELISSGSDTYDNTNNECTNLELVDTKCSSCGAPLKILSKYDIGISATCEYCGSVYEKRIGGY